MTITRTAPTIGERQSRDRADAVIDRASGDGGARLATFVASDESVDRYGDIIRASGWQLEHYRKNNTVLYGHQTDSLPIGKVTTIGVDGTRLLATVEFPPAGTTAFVDSVWAMLEFGALNAVSVGFLPLAPPDPIVDKDGQWTGFEFRAQELLELSVVPVPANPNALQIVKSFGLSADQLRCLLVDDGTAARVAAAAQSRTLTLSRLGRHQAALTQPHQGGD